MNNRLDRTNQLGFNLIELMIVVAIIGIIAAIAYPSYREYVMETRRASAQGALTELGSHMERFYTENFSYAGATVPDSISNDLEQYELNIVSNDATSYQLNAVPQGSQDNDRCGTLILNNTGTRGAVKSGNSIPDCW